MTEPAQPGRALLRLAGVFTQIACAGCLLLGTIAFVLVQQNKSGGTGYTIGWAAAAMIGLVFGGLMVRGGLISLLICALVDIGFGSVLLVLDKAALAGMLRVLSASDVEMIADALFGGAIGLIVVGALCFLAIPQAIRYNRWLYAGESGELAAASASFDAEYRAEFHDRPRTTNRGFPPPPIPASKSSMWLAPAAPPAERRSRRRMYFALGGFAIGFGAGIGVLVSSSTKKSAAEPTIVDTPKDAPPVNPDPPKVGSNTDRTPPKNDGNAGSAGSGSAGSNSVGSGSNVAAKPPAATTTVQAMLQEQRTAIAQGDVPALLATIAPTAIGFGIDADEVVEGTPAFEAQIKRDLGELVEGGVTVTKKFDHVGEAAGCAWIAQELDLSARGKSSKRIAITELACPIKNAWKVVAWHWALPVRDDTAERLALLGTKPQPKAIITKVDGPKSLEGAIKAAFQSRSAFAAARSERDDGFNYGSASEKMTGGAKIKSVFEKLRIEVKLRDGIRAVAPSSGIAAALLNVDFTSKTRAATDLTQTFRVLAVVIQEGSEWKIVSTQWSHGGPVR